MTRRKQLEMRHHPKVDERLGFRLPEGHLPPPGGFPSDPCAGKFLVKAEVVIGIQKFQIRYLHKDGRWRPGATTGDNDNVLYSGYYDTKKEASQALRRARDTYFVSETYRLYRFRRSQ